MFCPKCGKEINDEWNVCPECGTSLKLLQQEAATEIHSDNGYVVLSKMSLNKRQILDLVIGAADAVLGIICGLKLLQYLISTVSEYWGCGILGIIAIVLACVPELPFVHGVLFAETANKIIGLKAEELTKDTEKHRKVYIVSCVVYFFIGLVLLGYLGDEVTVSGVGLAALGLMDIQTFFDVFRPVIFLAIIVIIVGNVADKYVGFKPADRKVRYKTMVLRWIGSSESNVETSETTTNMEEEEK